MPNHPVKVGCFLTTGDALVAERLAHCDLDYLCVDLQHGYLTETEVRQCIQAISTCPDVELWLRLLSSNSETIGRAFDWGVGTVVLPMIETPQQVLAAIRATRYSPDGVRSFGPVRASFSRPPAANWREPATRIFVMIETLSALENLDAIVAVPGLAGVYVGPTDLGISLGYAPQDAFATKTRLHDAMKLIVEIAHHHGVIAASHAPTPDSAGEITAVGFDYITLGNDLKIFAEAIDNFAAKCRRTAAASM